MPLSSRLLFRLQLFLFHLLATLLIVCPTRILAGAGKLDPSFGENGVKTTSLAFADNPYNFSFYAEAVNQVLVDQDGRVLVLAETSSSFVTSIINYTEVIRLLSNGVRDNSVSVKLRCSNTYTPGGKDRAIALQSDGKLLLAHSVNVGSGAASQCSIHRFNSDGSVDSNFGNAGVRTFQFHVSPSSVVHGPRAIAVQPDGKIVITGIFRDTNAGWQIGLARLTAAGELDISFNGNGLVSTAFGSDAYPNAMALQPDGRILVAGSLNATDLLILRYDMNGNIDSSFSEAGILTVPGAGAATSLSLQSEGRLLVGTSNRVYRYTSNGTPDLTLGATGFIDTPGVSSVAVLPDGKFLTAGGSFEIARYTESGSPDATFFGGSISHPMGYTSRARSLALYPGGRFIVAGESTFNLSQDEDTTVAMFLGEASSEPLVWTPPKTTTSYRDFSPPVRLSGMASAWDFDSPDLDGGSLSITITDSKPDDVLGIANEGSQASQIGTSGNTVTFGGLPIGTFQTTTGTPLSLQVDFSGQNATPTAVDALVRAIVFSTADFVRGATPRNAVFVVDDGDGNLSTPATQSINVIVMDDYPTIDGISPMQVVGGVVQTIPLTGIGSGDGPETVSVTATSSDTTVIPHPNVAYTTPSSTGTLTFTAANKAGSAIITVRVTDQSGLQTTRQFSVSVVLQPVVSDENASNVRWDSATLNAFVNPGGLNTAVVLEYGATEALGSSIPVGTTFTGSSNSNVSANLSGLFPDTTYYFRFLATNSAGVGGEIHSFRTIPLPQPLPSITGTSHHSVTEVTATATATISANLTDASVSLEYSTDNQFWTSINGGSIGSGTSVTRSIQLQNLQPATSYFYRFVATNLGGTTVGETQTFTTEVGPVISITGFDNITANSARVNGRVASGIAPLTIHVEVFEGEIYRFTYICAPNPVSSVPLDVSAQLPGLSLFRTYWCRLKAYRGQVLVATGDWSSFTTLGIAPVAFTGSSSNVSSTSATVTGTATANDATASVTIQYGAESLNLIHETSPNTVSSTAPTPVSATLTDLQPGTTYYYRVFVTNPFGSHAGSVQSFTTRSLSAPSATNIQGNGTTATSASISALLTAGSSEATFRVEYWKSLTDAPATKSFGTVSANSSSQTEITLSDLAPHTAYSFKVLGNSTDGGCESAILSFSTPNRVPTATDDQLATTDVITFDPRSNDLDADGDTLMITAVTQPTHGSVEFTGTSITFSPAQEGDRVQTFSYTISDGFGGEAIGNVQVRGAIRPELIAEVGKPVPGAESGTTYGSFGTPEIGMFVGTIRETGQRKARKALFYEDGSLALTEGDPAPQIDGAIIEKITTVSGNVAVLEIHRVTGSGTPARFTVVYSNQSGSSALLTPVLTTHRQFGSFTIRRISSTDGNGTIGFALAEIVDGTVKPRRALVGFDTTAEGQPWFFDGELPPTFGISGKKFSTLVMSPGSSAEGRWRLDSDRMGLLSRTKANGPGIPVWATSPAGLSSRLALNLFESPGLSRYGLPGFGFNSFAAPLARSIVRSAGSYDVVASVASQPPDTNRDPMEGVSFQRFDTLVQGKSGTAFKAVIRGEGVKSSNNIGLWLYDDTPRLIARKGSPAAGGGRWVRFDSIVYPENAGVAFTGTVAAVDGETGPKLRKGLWRMNADGELELLLKVGETLNLDGSPRTVKSFKALTTSPGSVGAAHGHDSFGAIATVITFTDRSVALVRFGRP